MTNKKVKATVVAELQDKVSRKAYRMRKSVQGFNQEARLPGVTGRWRSFGKQVNAVNKGVSRLAKGIGLASVAAAAFSFAGGLNKTIALSERINQLGVNLGLNGRALVVFKKNIREAVTKAAIETTADPIEIFAGVEVIAEKIGDKKFAMATIGESAKAIVASGGAGADFGGLLSALAQRGQKDIKDVHRVLDAATGVGQVGAFTSKHLSGLAERVFSSGAPREIEDFIDVIRAMQIAKLGTGSPEMAASAFDAFTRMLNDVEKTKVLEAGGVRVFDREALSKGELKLRPFLDIMESIADVTKGSKFELSNLIKDSEARKAVNGALEDYVNNNGRHAKIEQLRAITGHGTSLDDDVKDMSEEAAARLRRMGTSVNKVVEDFFFNELDRFDPDAMAIRGEQLTGRAGRAYQAKVLRLQRESDVVPAQRKFRVPRNRRGVRSNKLTSPENQLSQAPQAPPVDVGGKVVIEINQVGRASIKSIKSNDSRVNYITKQNLGPRMPPE